MQITSSWPNLGYFERIWPIWANLFVRNVCLLYQYTRNINLTGYRVPVGRVPANASVLDWNAFRQCERVLHIWKRPQIENAYMQKRRRPERVGNVFQNLDASGTRSIFNSVFEAPQIAQNVAARIVALNATLYAPINMNVILYKRGRFA